MCLQVKKKYFKLRKHTLKNIDKSFYSLLDKPVFHKGLVLPDKKTYLSFENTCVKCPEIAPGYANAQPPGR